MLKLNFNLRHQAITLLNPGTIVATDSKNYLVANFNFISDDWEYPLTAIFTSDVEKIPYTILVGQSQQLEENECFIPWEVLQSSGNVYVSVFCGELHTTNTVKFKVVKSGYTEGEIPPSPTPTIYEQILQALDSKQPMLTAGQNITITEENVISASSGSDDYTDLTNKPSINNVTLSGNKSSDDLSLQGKLTAGANISIADGVISATISRNYFYNEQPNKLSYDFNFISLADQQKTGMWRIRNDATLQNLPSALESIRGRYFYVFNYPNAPYSTDSANYSIRKIITSTASGDFKEYAQIYSANNSGKVISQTDWVELTGGGTQIVSGVVNANGTITFTDSDGNTFTTTGSSVIGADGFSPVATVTQTASGATVSITDSTGTTTANISNGQDGNDYILTTQDKDDIADIVLAEFTGSIVNGELNTR